LRRALTGLAQGGSAERAIEWLFSHPDDTGEETAAAAASSEAAESKVGGDTTTPARYRLKAFVSHKGPSVHSGHYVAHIRTDAGWVLFNDEKVVRADDESVRALRALAYLYVFERE
jgi:ubiquitin carboxyl-terminal hydrolase 5/13